MLEDGILSFFLSFFPLVSIWIRSKCGKRRFDFHIFCVTPIWKRKFPNNECETGDCMEYLWTFCLFVDKNGNLHWKLDAPFDSSSARLCFIDLILPKIYVLFGVFSVNATVVVMVLLFFLALVFFVSYSLVIKWMPLAAEKKGYRSGSDAKKKRILCDLEKFMSVRIFLWGWCSEVLFVVVVSQFLRISNSFSFS